MQPCVPASGITQKWGWAGAPCQRRGPVRSGWPTGVAGSSCRTEPASASSPHVQLGAPRDYIQSEPSVSAVPAERFCPVRKKKQSLVPFRPVTSYPALKGRTKAAILTYQQTFATRYAGCVRVRPDSLRGVYRGFTVSESLSRACPSDGRKEITGAGLPTRKER